jgi:hypothetical protein
MLVRKLESSRPIARRDVYRSRCIALPSLHLWTPFSARIIQPSHATGILKRPADKYQEEQASRYDPSSAIWRENKHEARC